MWRYRIRAHHQPVYSPNDLLPVGVDDSSIWVAQPSPIGEPGPGLTFFSLPALRFILAMKASKSESTMILPIDLTQRTDNILIVCPACCVFISHFLLEIGAGA